jgi:sulfide dehydrogenase [flavocytochrome c] flavoprotein subunit
MRRRDFLRLTALAGAGAATGAHSSARARPDARVVIVGGGFAGSACALAIRRLDPRIAVTLIDANDRYVTCPMSNEALVGLRSLASLSVDRAGLARAGVRFVRDRVIAVAADARQVRTAGGASIEYDRLVVAPGVRFLWGTPEGYDEPASTIMPHAWNAGRQTELLAARLRAMQKGGIVAISVPAGLMRCPPGPYERASLIAGFLKEHKPRSKVLIFDANNHFPRQDVFTAAWKSHYGGIVEWIPVVDGGAVLRVDAAQSTLHTSNGPQRVAVANIIPPQAPGELAVAAGLATGHGWCPVDRVTFESPLVPGVHVIGDACIADAMPKSASAACSQARQCAAAIVAALGGQNTADPEYESVCYSMLAPDDALAIRGRFEVADHEIRSVGASARGMSDALSASGRDEAAHAQAWYREIRKTAFGA